MADFLDNITRRFLSPKEQREILNGTPRYIDSNILLLNFAKRRSEQKGIYIALCEAEGLIRNAPSVDAVEVVRCKDCKHCDKEREQYCWLHDINVTDNDFCKWGEKE